MTRCDDTTATTTPCGCEACCTDDLPVSPFLALRVAYGMLLGEDDFRALMGNPRGKQMVHTSWLHGTGVVWGFRTGKDGERVLKVSPGLALDGLGRELLLEATQCLDVRDWLTSQDLPGTGGKTEGECDVRTVGACLLVEFSCCPTAPVPTLADPCDVTRKHDDYSRVVETARVVLRPGGCPDPPRPYHRVRVLLGLDGVGPDDPAGDEALAAAIQVAATPAAERTAELLRLLRFLAAEDVMDLRPAGEPDGDECCNGMGELTLFPVAEDDAAVVLACVEIDVRDHDGCLDVVDLRVDPTCRTALLPTATIQELTCGLAPGVLGTDVGEDAGGPRVVPESLEWLTNGRGFGFAVTAPLIPGSVTRRQVELTSLSEEGWVAEDVYRVEYDPAGPGVVVEVADRPVNDIVRLIVKGTGRMPIFGEDPAVPLAGLVGGPPGTANDGHDAVLTFRNPIDRSEA